MKCWHCIPLSLKASLFGRAPSCSCSIFWLYQGGGHQHSWTWVSASSCPTIERTRCWSSAQRGSRAHLDHVFRALFHLAKSVHLGGCLALYQCNESRSPAFSLWLQQRWRGYRQTPCDRSVFWKRSVSLSFTTTSPTTPSSPGRPQNHAAYHLCCIYTRFWSPWIMLPSEVLTDLTESTFERHNHFINGLFFFRCNLKALGSEHVKERSYFPQFIRFSHHLEQHYCQQII